MRLIDWLINPPRWIKPRNLGKSSVLPVLILLGACAHRPEPIKVPVPVPCIPAGKAPKRPDYPAVQAEAGLFERVKTLLAERELRIGYEGELEAVVSACQ